MFREISSRYLSPSDRLSEMMFGLIMAMTVISATRLAVGEGELSPRIVIYAALGCNIAWGIVDAIMYLFTALLDRGRQAQFISSLSAINDEKTAIDFIGEELQSTVLGTLDEQERTRVSAEILKGIPKAQPENVHITKDDIYGALLCFVLVFVTAFAVVIPFFLFRGNLFFSLRISHLTTIVMLFSVGYEWARYTNRSKIKTGIAMVLLGLTVNIAVTLLGG